MHDGGIVRFFFARLATFVVAHVTFPKGFWCLVFSGMQPQVLVCGTFGLFSRTEKSVLLSGGGILVGGVGFCFNF